MASNASNQRIIPLEEGWNQEIKAKVRLYIHGTEHSGKTANSFWIEIYRIAEFEIFAGFFVSLRTLGFDPTYQKKYFFPLNPVHDEAVTQGLIS